MSEAGIEVDVIVQNAAADGTNDITFTVKRGESERAKSILDNIASSLKARAVDLDTKICKVSLVGVGMRSHAGIASKMFKALAQESINIQIITTSEIKISVVIEEKYLELPCARCTALLNWAIRTASTAVPDLSAKPLRHKD